MGTDVNITPTAGMPPVTTETVGAPVTTTGISTNVPNAASLEALGNQQAAANSVAAGELAVTPTIGQTVEGQALGKDAEAQQELDNNVERSKLIAAKMPAIEQAEKDHQAAQDRYANHTFYDYLANRSAGDKITSRIALALNAGANAYLGIPGNELAEQLQNDVNRDFEKQKVQLHSKEKIAEWKKEGVKDLYGKLQTELAALDVKQAGAMRAVGAKAAAMALRAGIPEAEAKQNVVVAKADESAAKLDLSAKQRYEKQATSSTVGQTHSIQTTAAKGSGGGVEADKNAANFAVLKAHGEKIADKMADLNPVDVAAINRVMNSEDFLDGKPLAVTIGSVLGVDSETGVSSNAKAFLADVRAASEGLGRVQSGAAIGTVENKRFVRSMLPQVSDTREDRKMRATNVKADIDARGAYMARPARNAPAAGNDPIVSVKDNETGKITKMKKSEADKLMAQ